MAAADGEGRSVALPSNETASLFQSKSKACMSCGPGLQALAGGALAGGAGGYMTYE